MCLVVFLNVEVSILFSFFSVKWCCLCILFNSCCSCRSVASSCFGFLMNSCWLCLSVNFFVRYSELMLFMHICCRWTCVCALQWTRAVHAYLLSVNLCLCITVNSCCTCISVKLRFVFVVAELVVCAAWWTLGLLYVTVQFSELCVDVCCAGPWPVWCVWHRPYARTAQAIAAFTKSLHQTTRYPCMYRDLFSSFVYCLSGTVCFL